jgi:hypothetical protein
MATGQSTTYDLPYPLVDDNVNVHGDIRQLVERLEAVLPLASYSQLAVTNNTSELMTAGDPVYVTGFNSETNSTTVARAKHDTSNPILGLVKTNIPAGQSGVVVVAGVVQNINTSAFTAGDILYSGESGGLTNQLHHGAAVCVVVYAAETGIVSVDSKGNGTWGALKAGLA